MSAFIQRWHYRFVCWFIARPDALEADEAMLHNPGGVPPELGSSSTGANPVPQCPECGIRHRRGENTCCKF